MIDCGENVVYTYDVLDGAPPQLIAPAARGNVTFTMLNPGDSSTITILAATKESFTVMALSDDGVHLPGSTDEVYEEDSIFEILAGRASEDKTARLEFEAESEEYTDTLDDTFDGRRAVRPDEIDPLDDSQIF